MYAFFFTTWLETFFSIFSKILFECPCWKCTLSWSLVSLFYCYQIFVSLFISSELMGFWIATQLKTSLSIFRSMLFDCPFWRCKLNWCLIFFLFYCCQVFVWLCIHFDLKGFWIASLLKTTSQYNELLFDCTYKMHIPWVPNLFVLLLLVFVANFSCFQLTIQRFLIQWSFTWLSVLCCIH